MKVFKGFTKDLTATYGEGVFHYEAGKKYKEEQSKTRRTGFHSAEYILDCMNWYGLERGNRFFLCEAEGSLDEEDGCSMVVSTELTLLKELSLLEIAGYAMSYIVAHPKRAWEARHAKIEVNRDKAEATDGNLIAIARGENPVVIGEKGTIIGLILDDSEGNPIAARVCKVAGFVKPNVKYTLTEDRKLEEIEK